MTYERNRFRTQRNFLYQGRHHRDVGFGNGNSRGRSMIFGPRLSYTKEDIIEMLDLVMEIVGEEV